MEGEYHLQAWFNSGFVPQVCDHLIQKNSLQKTILLLDNMPLNLRSNVLKTDDRK